MKKNNNSKALRRSMRNNKQISQKEYENLVKLDRRIRKGWKKILSGFNKVSSSISEISRNTSKINKNIPIIFNNPAFYDTNLKECLKLVYEPRK
jgi:hypothetical protein